MIDCSAILQDTYSLSAQNFPSPKSSRPNAISMPCKASASCAFPHNERLATTPRPLFYSSLVPPRGRSIQPLPVGIICYSTLNFSTTQSTVCLAASRQPCPLNPQTILNAVRTSHSPPETSPPQHHTYWPSHQSPSPKPRMRCPHMSGCGYSSLARRDGGSSNRRTRRWDWETLAS